MAGTRTDKASRRESHGDELAVLVAVLSYDDLLAPDSLVLPLPRAPRVSLGRAETGPRLALSSPVDVAIRDAFASTRHAVIRRGETDVLSDLDSTNGTFVNGQRVRDYPLVDGDLIEIGHSLLCYRRLAGGDELAALGRSTFGPVVTFSPGLARLARDLRRIAPSKEPVLLLAESGAGKEVAARMIHTESGRAGELVTLDGGAIPEALFEATLVGHARGAFTGATEAQPGALVRAHGGTLFLDEVANLSAAAQAKLLRVWEEGSVLPVGGARARQVDVRFLAATNGSLQGEGFRDDLRQRMAGFVARIPPLRHRREDLGVLVAHLLGDAGIRRARIVPEAGRRFFSRAFLGNVRELRRVLRAAALLAQDEPFALSHLGDLEPARPASVGPLGERAAVEQVGGEGDEVEERLRLVRALTATRGNIVRTAADLGTHPRQVYRMVSRHGLAVTDFRPTRARQKLSPTRSRIAVCRIFETTVSKDAVWWADMDPNPHSIVSDRRRLQAVSELDFESSGRHQALDDLAELVAEVLDVPTVLVSIIDRDVQRLPGAAGLPEPIATTRELPLSSSLCTTVVESSTALVIYDAANDPRVAHHPSVRGLGVAAYLGVPIGQNDAGPLGTLCAIDERPRSWTPRDLRLLRSLAVAADTLLAARRGQHSSGSHERVFRSFVGSVTHPIVIADAAGRVTHANDAARACLGREAVGDPWDPGPGSDIMQADGKTPYAHGEDPLARALRGEATRGERVRWAPSTAWFDVTALPVRDDAGQTIGAISFWHDVTGPHAMQERLSALVDRDELTGLRNRRSFLATADEMLGLARRRRMRTTLVVVDLDGLKPINDQHGHEGGDDAIRGLAAVVSAALPEGAAVGRLSGDEMACLWVHAEPNAEASVRTRLTSALADYNRAPARRIRLSVSVGAAVQGPDEVATLDELLRNADAARITEKRAKR